MADEPGPWDDFAPTKESGPWDDFAPSHQPQSLGMEGADPMAISAIPQPFVDRFKNGDLSTDNLPIELKKLFGVGGEERYQLWPERMVRSALSAPLDALTGKLPVSDPDTGMPSDEAISRAGDVANMVLGTTVFNRIRPGKVEAVGTLPKPEDFQAAAQSIDSNRVSVRRQPTPDDAPPDTDIYHIYQGEDRIGEASLSGDGLPKGEKNLMWIGRGGEPEGGLVDRGDTNTLGPSVVRGALRDYKRQNPDVTKIRGTRISGARDPEFGEAPDIEISLSSSTERNLRDLWQDDGIHPSEAAHDAKSDAFLRQELETPPYHPPDRSGIATPTNSIMPAGTPRTEIAKTGDPLLDAMLEHPTLREVVNNPVIDDTHTIPNSWGGSVPLENPTVYIDKDFPRSLTVDGVTFDPADAAAVHENVEQMAMDMLTKNGMDRATALKVAFWEFGEKAEDAFYASHGMDPVRVEETLAPIVNIIAERRGHDNVPPDLFKGTYPDGNPAKTGPGPIDKPTAAEIKQAREIIAKEQEGQLTAAGADVTRPENLPSLEQQPPPRRGTLSAAVKDAGQKLLDIGNDIQMKTTPMAAGSSGARAIAKDFANNLRRNRWEWSRYDDDLRKRFDPEQRKRMWDAADEESVARQLGESTENQGLVTLEPAERAVVEDLQARAQAAWLQAKDLDMVASEGLPAYTPRMVLNVASATEHLPPASLNELGRNVFTRTAQMRHRKYMMAEETEKAAKELVGKRMAERGASQQEIEAALEDVKIARDIRALPLATAKLEDAVAGRTLINKVEEYGKSTGTQTVSYGAKPGKEWFTIDHPAFKRWEPSFETNPVTGKIEAKLDDAGNPIFKQVPLYVHGDFEGPLRAVLSEPSGAAYGALMSLKGKTMGLIMNSPLIHNAVEWGRSLSAMPGKVATFRVYFDGALAKKDPVQMREAIDAGMVPIGHRFFNQDINAIMEEPNLTPGRSWTAQVLGAVPGLFDEAAGDAVKAAIDKAGNFWHNTLLWDRVADLQMGLYTNFRDANMAKGMDRLTSARVAAHWANRYAGALPKEAMSAGATKLSNLMLFSRSFTMGNIGVMKDMLTGLPRDVMAQIERDGGLLDPKAIRSQAIKKAVGVVLLEMGFMYFSNSILQSGINVIRGDSTVPEEMKGYADRLSAELQAVKEHPLKLLQPMAAVEGLSATSANEPGREERLRVGYAADGTAIYARSPVGKIGEEFSGYLSGPLDMIKKKLGTIARPGFQIMANDAGFGRKIYDPSADTPAKYLQNLGAIAAHIVGSQLPEGQMNAFADLVKGDGDPKVNALQAFGPIAGVTFSKGAPGGPAVGELYNARTQHQFGVDAAMPDIRKQIQRGDIAGAQDRMTQLGVPPGLQRFYIRTSMDPATRLGGRTLRDFYQYSTPEQRERLLNAPRVAP